jgi:hypothetical protein
MNVEFDKVGTACRNGYEVRDIRQQLVLIAFFSKKEDSGERGKIAATYLNLTFLTLASY